MPGSHNFEEYAYPGPLGARGLSLGVSGNGRWLYTLPGCVRAKESHLKPARGGTLPEQAIIYTFDTTISEFLPRAAETDYEPAARFARPGSRERALLCLIPARTSSVRERGGTFHRH